MAYDIDPESRRVVVVDIRMPFWSMVSFMVKWAVASIPAFMVLTALGMVILAVLGAMLRPLLPF